MVHNGTWTEGSKLAEKKWAKGGPWESDTSIMAQFVDKLGFVAAMKQFSPGGVWLWQDYSGKLWVHLSWGSLWHSPVLDCWASEPPTNHLPAEKWYEVANGDYAPGELPRKHVRPTAHFDYSSWRSKYNPVTCHWEAP